MLKKKGKGRHRPGDCLLVLTKREVESLSDEGGDQTLIYSFCLIQGSVSQSPGRKENPRRGVDEETEKQGLCTEQQTAKLGPSEGSYSGKWFPPVLKGRRGGYCCVTGTGLQSQQGGREEQTPRRLSSRPLTSRGASRWWGPNRRQETRRPG